MQLNSSLFSFFLVCLCQEFIRLRILSFLIYLNRLLFYFTVSPSWTQFKQLRKRSLEIRDRDSNSQPLQFTYDPLRPIELIRVGESVKPGPHYDISINISITSLMS